MKKDRKTPDIKQISTYNRSIMMIHGRMSAKEPIIDVAPQPTNVLDMSQQSPQLSKLQLMNRQALNIISKEEDKRTSEASTAVEQPPISTTFLDGEHPASAGNWSAVSNSSPIPLFI